MKSLSIVVLLGLIVFVNCRKECIHRDYGYGSTVCVCNTTYCDDLDPLAKTSRGVVTVFETTKSGDRFAKTELKFGDNYSKNAAKTQSITIDRIRALQSIVGFGGAFTDSVGLNIKSLPQILQNSIISDYFAETGIQYTLGRIPIGGSDFSTHAYSYDDNNTKDFDLKYFKLAKEDFDYKISYLKAAQKASGGTVRYFGSTWSPPAWMKNNSQLNHGGYLIGQPGGQAYKAFAKYIVKFLDTYKSNGVPIWGITVENEPKAGNDPNYRFNCLGFTPEIQRDFLKLDLGPIMAAAGYGINTTALMIFDDQRSHIQEWTKVILKDKEAAQYVSGTAFHWYENHAGNVVNLDIAHADDPSKFILNTEACEEWKGKPKHVYLGHWDTFERYANDIIVDLNHWTSGWVDWNLVLDCEGGPNWVSNFVDAPIIVNASAQEYYKQPMFYALGHYSKFLPTGALRLERTEQSKVDKFETTAFLRPDNGTVVVALNLSDESVELTIIDTILKQKVSHTVKPRSIQTYIYY